uniref:Osteoclast-stimulating factor 1 n=1 Tax=Esox lucius TaxID=8010 RepID=A0A6Q2X6F4_ESOLU
MPDPVSTCTYNLLYQDLKRFSKNGEHFCKELMTVFQQRYALMSMHTKLALGNALQAEAISDIRQVIEEHNKRKRTLDTVVEKTRKNVNTNWSEQIKVKKTLFGLTREHEDLFNFVENNAHICTEKEKQKMLNRLTKSAEAQTRADEQYFNINMDGHQIRLKWENALKNCYQIIQELEKQRLEVLCKILNKYNLYMASFRQTLIHKQIEQAIQRVDVEKDILILLEETSGTAEDNKAEFLMTDYFEENSKSLMEKGRRKEAIRSKLLRLEDCITKTKKDCDGLDRLIKNYSDNPSFSSKNNLEETEQLLEEATLKLDLLEATHYKLSTTLAELDGKPKSSHKFSDSITKWKEKVRSFVNLARHLHKSSRSAMSKNETEERGAQWICIGKCKALYDFTSDKEDELNMKEGDLLEIYQKEDSGWWYGILNGQIGHFPSTYVEELPMLSVVETFDV